jgi:hypothetical protein
MPAYTVTILIKTTTTLLAPSAKEAGKAIIATLREGDVLHSVIPVAEKEPSHGDSPPVPEAADAATSAA